MSILGYSPEVGNAPADWGIFGDSESFTGRVVCNSAGYSQSLTSERVSYHPRVPHSRYATGIGALLGSVAQAGGGAAFPASGSATFAQIPDAGITGTDSALRFGMVADPDNSSRSALLYRVRQGDGVDTAGSQRVELGANNPTNQIARGVRHWASLSVRLPATWKDLTTADGTIAWQIHTNPDGSDIGVQNPPVAMVIFGGGIGSPQLSKQEIIIRTDAAAVTDPANYITTRWPEYDWPADVWQHWVFEFVLHWDASQNPYFKAWRALGDAGAPVLMVDHRAPNSYNNAADDYMKCGLYYYSGVYSNGLTDRVCHNKGLHLWRHQPGMSVGALLAFARGI